MKLNIGCGDNTIDGFIGIDPYSEKSDSKHDFFKDGPYKYEAGSISEIVMFHCIEHIEARNQPVLIQEFHRLLVDGGSLIISYPEFIKCAKNYIENKNGQREFWAATIYGRQLHEGDYHVTPMNSPDFKNLLQCSGFVNIGFFQEPGQDFNTVCCASKGPKPMNYEELVFRDMENLTVTV